MVVTGVPVWTSGPAGAADPVAKVVTVVPSDGLADKQVVTVTWSGFAPGPAFVRQCMAGATSWKDCSERTQVAAATGTDGRGSIQVTARAGYIHSDTGNNAPLTCDGTASCEFVVSECGFSLPTDRRAAAPASFMAPLEEPVEVIPGLRVDRELEQAPPAEASTKPALHAIGGSGSHLVINRWQNSLRRPPYGLNIDYTPTNSPSGIQTLLDFPRSYDFTITGMPLDAAQVDRFSASGRAGALAPVVLSGLALAYRLEPQGIPVTDLRLSPETVAGIYSGKISSLSDPAVTADNRGCALPNVPLPLGRWQPLFRTDQSVSNLLASSWLDARGGSNWVDRFGARLGSGLIFPQNAGTGLGAFGSRELAKRLSVGPYDAPRIGFVDLTWARFYDLPVAELKTAAGSYVAPTPDSISRAVEAGTVLTDGTIAPTFDAGDPGAYPLPSVSYLLAQTKLGPNLTPEKGQVLKELLDYAISSPGQQDAEAFGAVPLTPALRATSARISGRIPTEAPTMTTATLPPSAPATLPPSATTSAATPDESLGTEDTRDASVTAATTEASTTGGSSALASSDAGASAVGPGGPVRRPSAPKAGSGPRPRGSNAEPADPGTQAVAPGRAVRVAGRVPFSSAGLVPSLELIAMAGLAVLVLGRLSRWRALAR